MQNILVAFTVSKYNNNGKGSKQKNKMKIQTLLAKGKFAAIWLLNLAPAPPVCCLSLSFFEQLLMIGIGPHLEFGSHIVAR